MKHALKNVIVITCLFIISYFISPAVHAEPVELYSLVNQDPEPMPIYSVVDAATIRNEQTGMIYTLERFKQRSDVSSAEGRRWLADMAFMPVKNIDVSYPVFLPIGCKAIISQLSVCNDIVMPQYKGDSISRTGITSGHVEEIKPYSVRKYL